MSKCQSCGSEDLKKETHYPEHRWAFLAVILSIPLLGVWVLGLFLLLGLCMAAYTEGTWVCRCGWVGQRELQRQDYIADVIKLVGTVGLILGFIHWLKTYR